MADHDDEELRMALQMSLQPPPEAKRSKPRENAGTGASMEVSEANARRLQRELRASAAEERMLSAQTPRVQTVSSNVHMQQGSGMAEVKERPLTAEKSSPQQVYRGKRSIDDESQGLSVQQSEQLYSMVFGPQVTKDVLSQWCNQGFRFSSEPGTSTGLVQREGGPCGVLAPIQALVLKNLLFAHEEGGGSSVNVLQHNLGYTDAAMPEHKQTRYIHFFCLTNSVIHLLIVKMLIENKSCTSRIGISRVYLCY